ncbi:hypothetical protein PV325_012918, partial [Microctonus aethiopoides]
MKRMSQELFRLSARKYMRCAYNQATMRADLEKNPYTTIEVGKEGFGFITFADPSSVDKVLAQGNHELDGKK